MKEARDPAIKLFGKKIALPANGKIPDVSVEDHSGDRSPVMSDCLEEKEVNRTRDEEQGEEDNQVQADDKESVEGKPSDTEQQAPFSITKEPTNQGKMPDSDDNPKTPAINEENATAKFPKSENDQSDANNPEQKTLKKPDKIIPCPRCNSMETKFCYYNNYNINQPRHFCKSCQRYWTAGGTMRNVPVGAGRRKNKNPPPHCRHITISEALQAARIDAPNGIHHQAFRTNGTVLSFGPEAPTYESIASVLSLPEKKAPNGFHKVEEGLMPASCNGGENGDDCSSGSSIAASNSKDEGVRNGLTEAVMRGLNGFSPQVPCLPGVPWPYPWNSAVPVPAFCPPGFPMPFYPPPYWNCSVPGAWSVPWLSPQSPMTNQKPPSGAPTSPTLGKHSRDGNLIKPVSTPGGKEPVEQNNPERSILIPKTLRIDDPDEAARSSIWATLGIKNDSISNGGLFKAFHPKGNQKSHVPETPRAMHANPAAMSRSFSFQESS